MKTAYFKKADIKFCNVPIPPIDNHKIDSSVVFTSNQISKYSQSQTHPSIVYNASGWNGHKWWLATTPYPYATGVFENPCIYYADDQNDEKPPIDFTPISGTASGDYTMVSNPIVKVTTNEAVNSDPDIILIDNTMYLISRNNIVRHTPYMQKSLTGQAWTVRDSDPLWDDVNMGLPELISPSFVKIGNKIRAYCCTGTTGTTNVDIPNASGVSWGTYIMEGTTFENGGDFQYVGKCYISGDKKVQPWHMDVCEHNGVYYMVVCAKEIGSGTNAMHLFLAKSTDGITFHMFSKPLFNAYNQYRPTICVDASNNIVIYGAITNANPSAEERGIATEAPDGRYIFMVTDSITNIIGALEDNEWSN